MCTAPLLSSCWLGTKRQGPEQRDLYAAPSPRGLPGPVFFSSRAAGIQWAETLPPAPLWRHKRPFCTGALEPLPRGGERPGLLQRADCVLGPRERAGPGQQRTGASLSPACQAAVVGWGGGASGKGEGPGVAWRQVEGPVPVPVAGDPISQLSRRSAFWKKQGGTGWPCGVRNPMHPGACPALPRRGRADSPGSPLKAASFSGKFSSSLYFWSQRNSFESERTVLSPRSAGTTRCQAGPRSWCLLPRQVSGLGQGSTGGSSVCPGLLSTPPEADLQESAPRAGRVCPKHLQPASEFPAQGLALLPRGTPAPRSMRP